MITAHIIVSHSFNTQPPEGGWVNRLPLFPTNMIVSTHSRLKAAGTYHYHRPRGFSVSTHSRLKAAGLNNFRLHQVFAVSTHSRLKAAGFCVGQSIANFFSFNTQPPEGGWDRNQNRFRYRLVSTHSRLKAAGCHCRYNRLKRTCFNTQPPEGGWQAFVCLWGGWQRFQHTAA